MRTRDVNKTVFRLEYEEPQGLRVTRVLGKEALIEELSELLKEELYISFLKVEQYSSFKALYMPKEQYYSVYEEQCYSSRERMTKYLGKLVNIDPDRLYYNVPIRNKHKDSEYLSVVLLSNPTDWSCINIPEIKELYTKYAKLSAKMKMFELAIMPVLRKRLPDLKIIPHKRFMNAIQVVSLERPEVRAKAYERIKYVLYEFKLKPFTCLAEIMSADSMTVCLRIQNWKKKVFK